MITSVAAKDIYGLPGVGKVKLEGLFDTMITRIQERQLMDPVLWEVMTEQFRAGSTDDADLGWRGEFWGKMMRGASITYAYTADPALYRILETSVKEMLEIVRPDGRISTYSKDRELREWDVWCRKYVLLGLIYFYEICQDPELSDNISRTCARILEYMMQYIGAGEGKKPITETSVFWNGLNSSSLLEPVVKVYELTGDPGFLRFAEEIIAAGGTRGFDMIDAIVKTEQAPWQFPVTKAYEMTSFFEGLLEYYRATGKREYLDISLEFARRVIGSDITAVGSAGTTHELFDHSRSTQFDPSYKIIKQETCVTVTWMRFCLKLFLASGDQSFLDQAELSSYNALPGAVNWNDCRIRNQIFPFDSYSPLINGVRGRQVGGYKDVIRGQFWWGCCVAIGPAGTGQTGRQVFLTANDGVLVTMYESGQAELPLPDAGRDAFVKLSVDSGLPEQGNVRITVEPHGANGPESKEFTLYLRIPSWSRETGLSVCGETETAPEPGKLLALRKIWNVGDTVELSLDMRVRVIRSRELDPEYASKLEPRVCFARGPVILAHDAEIAGELAGSVGLNAAGGYVPCEKAPDIPGAYRIPVSGGVLLLREYYRCGRSWSADLPVTVWIPEKHSENQ